MGKCLDAENFGSDKRIFKFFEEQQLKDNQESHFGDEERNPKVTKLFNSVLNFLKGKDLTGEKAQRATKRALRRFVKEQKGEQAALAGEILSRIKAHPLIMEMMYHEIIREASRYNQKNPVSNMEWFTNEKFERVPVLESLPVTTLRVILWKTYNAINEGRMFKDDRGLIGNLQYEWGSPRQMALKDPSGLMFAINQQTETYTMRSQRYANTWLYAPTSKKARKIRDFGVHSISEEVDDFSRITGLKSEVGFRLFSEVMAGKTIIKEDGTIVSYAEEVKLNTGNWVWMNEIPFVYEDNYNEEVLLEKLDKEVDVLMGESSYDVFTNAIKQSRALFEEIGREMVSQIESNATEEGILKAAAKKAGLTNWLEEHIGHMLDPNVEIAGLNAGRMVSGEKYYPRMWLRALIPIQFENAINAQQAQMERKRLALRNPESKLNATTRNKLLREINTHQGSIIALEEKMSYIQNPETPIDLHTGQPVNTRVYYKNFKNLTRIMDPNFMRNDEDVMSDYVTEMSRAVTRNKAIIAVGKALLKAKINGANDNTINASMGIFNTTFYSPQAASQFMGVDMNPNKVSRDLASVGINISGRTLTNFFNGLSAFTTFNLLWGPMQGWVNATAYALKVDRSGFKAVADAEMQMWNPKTRKMWKRLSKEAGMETFQDFVGSYFNRTMRPRELEANAASIKRLKGLIADARKTGKTNKLVKYKQQLKNTTQGRALNILNKMAQYAITRQVDITANSGLWKKALATGSDLSKKFMPTIDDTENMLRSRSFVIGAMAAVASGEATSVDSKEAIRRGIDYAMATDFGLSHQHVGAALRGPMAGSTINKMKIWHNQKQGSNWRIMRNDIISRTSGLKNPNSFGNKVNNSFRLGVSGIKVPIDWLFNFNPLFSIEGSTNLGRGSLKAQREVNPYSAGSFTLNIREGLITVLMDMVVFAPGATFAMSPFIKSAFFKNQHMGKGMQGMGSPLISLAIAITQWSRFLLSGEKEDQPEEEYNIWQKTLRAGPIGIGGMSAIAAMMWVHQKMFDKDLAEKRHKTLMEDPFRRFITPYLPLGNTGYEIGKKAKYGYDYVVDYYKGK